MKYKTETKRLFVFFAVTLIWTWSCGLLAYIFHSNLSVVNAFFILGGPAPSIVGFLMVMKPIQRLQKKIILNECSVYNLKKLNI